MNVGPLRGRKAARELADQLNSLFKLRQCGRNAPAARAPARSTGRWAAAASPCLGDLDPNAYRRQLDKALALFDGPGDAGERLLGYLDEQMREASEARRYERAAALLRRRERLAVAARAARGDAARRARTGRGWCSPRHPVKERFDVFWIVDGRVADWGPLPGFEELVERTDAALAQPAAPAAATVRPEEVDEVRIVAAWIAEHEPPALALDPAPASDRLLRFVERASPDATASAAAA